MGGERAGEFEFEGYRLAYGEWGEGERAVVLVHGLLMNRRMFDRLAPELASRGYRVITLDLLGHGCSDRPTELQLYNTPSFARQLSALCRHLGLERPVIGGTSLGANTSLELAVAEPDLPRALVLEMPVLDNALYGVALSFTPVLLALRFGRPPLRALAALTRRVPRTHYLVDILLDWVRQDPAPSSAVLEGIFFGRIAPSRSERKRIGLPALVIGHRGEPVHPFSDAGALAEELPNGRLVPANSILEWRLAPSRLDDVLDEFLTEAFAETRLAAA
jgi:pimeloyl-ACP methyl ester carboxylesterase